MNSEELYTQLVSLKKCKIVAVETQNYLAAIEIRDKEKEIYETIGHTYDHNSHVSLLSILRKELKMSELDFDKTQEQVTKIGYTGYNVGDIVEDVRRRKGKKYIITGIRVLLTEYTAMVMAKEVEYRNKTFIINANKAEVLNTDDLSVCESMTRRYKIYNYLNEVKNR